MKQILSFCLVLCCLTEMAAQEKADYKEKQPNKSWGKLAPSLDDAFFHTEEARRIADNVLLYQQTTGGWPKNIYMPAELSAEDREKVIAAQSLVNESTIDNTATTTEIRYLARTYLATQDEKYKTSVLRGFQYLFDAQYPNGGWPQFYPRPKGYYTHITYNDDAMINVLEMLREAYEKQAPYSFLPDEVCSKAHKAFDKGIECILKTQIQKEGKLTVWCAQHDRETLAPTKARAYELPSFSGQESDEIVLLLLSLKQPSKEVIAAIEGAVEWFKSAKIEGLKKEYYTNAEGKKDYRMVPCTDCPPLWARFYDLDTNQPFFSDRDGMKKQDLSEIGYERRNGYSWYNTAGTKVLNRYEKWKKKLNE